MNKNKDKLKQIEKIVKTDYNNGRTLKKKLVQKIINSGKCPKDFCKKLEEIQE